MADKLVHGDVSGWARATTKAIRPDVDMSQREAFTPIRSLKGIRPMPLLFRAHDANAITLPGASKDESVAKIIEKLDKSIKDLNTRIDTDLTVMRFRASTIINRAKAPVLVKPAEVDLLADCEPSHPDVIAKLRGNMIERD